MSFLSGKVAVVTGGNRGIGRGIAEALAREGATLALTARAAAAAEQAAREVGGGAFGAAYNASKFGLNGFSEALMMEVRYDGIRVSYLMPGSVATEFGRGARDKMDWALRPEDVAEVVLDLLRAPARALYSRVELRPSRPPRKG